MEVDIGTTTWQNGILLASAVILIVGAAFAGLQLRAIRRSRKEELLLHIYELWNDRDFYTAAWRYREYPVRWKDFRAQYRPESQGWIDRGVLVNFFNTMASPWLEQDAVQVGVGGAARIFGRNLLFHIWGFRNDPELGDPRHGHHFEDWYKKRFPDNYLQIRSDWEVQEAGAN